MPNATGPITRGVRGNSSFESLTLTPDGQTLFTATETALAQDGNTADFDHGALSRLMEYRREGETFIDAEQGRLHRKSLGKTCCAYSGKGIPVPSSCLHSISHACVIPLFVGLHLFRVHGARGR